MIPTGDPGLDECLDGGYQQGALHVVAGRVGSGKTTWLRRSIRLALNAGKSVHVVDLEDTIGRHFRDDRHITVITRIEDLSQGRQADLLVLDCVQLHTPPTGWTQDTRQGTLAQWIASWLVPELQAMEHPIKLMSWQTRRDQFAPVHSDQATSILPTILPRALGYTADVVLHVSRQENGEGRGVLRKNRFGSTGQEFGYTLPELRPIVRRTLWQRLNETV